MSVILCSAKLLMRHGRSNVLKIRKRQNKSTYNKQADISKIDVNKIRNIGIMAHIDAGKTTTTERMLYYSGFTKHLGDVNDGDTVMDFMEQERNRGITITSAAITFLWKQHKINLIDTPGHVDFTVEVERSLRVLDGAVTILDASAGVESQTITVWRQANKFNIPRIIYLNKMDKHDASVDNCINSVKNKLKSTPLLIQVPAVEGKSFQGIIDVIFLKKHLWDNENIGDGCNYNICDLDTTDSNYDEVIKVRSTLIETLADFDDTLGMHVLNDTKYDQIPSVDIMNALRRATLSQSVVPILCGSSFKNMGVQPLMNAVVSFLPNPLERMDTFWNSDKDSLCALAFKTIYDKHKGALTFLRIYNGTISTGNSLYNVNRECNEKASRLLQVYADEHKEIQSAHAGNIVAVSGLKETYTGDTLVSRRRDLSTAKQVSTEDHDLPEDTFTNSVLAGVEVPDPVFMCSIEPPSMASQKALDEALRCLTKEDPSLRVHVDPDTCQTILSGMGELHLEVIHERICKEFGIDADLGPLMISYREALLNRVENRHTLQQVTGNTKHQVEICISVEPVEGYQQKDILMKPHTDSVMDPKRIRRSVLKAINNGVNIALSRGPLLKFPVIDVQVSLHDFRAKYGTSLSMISACTAACIADALKQSSSVLLEPMMKLEIHTDEVYVGSVLSDLSKRRSQILEISSRQDIRTIEANTPLSEMVGYATALRTFTSGRASFTMELSHYDQMSQHDQKRTIEKLTGFVAQY